MSGLESEEAVVRGGFHWARKCAIGLVLVLAVLSVLSLVVMALWNALMPALFHTPTLTFWQAAGLLVLSRILFGGIHGPGRWRSRWRERWDRLTPEEQERLRERLGRCGRRSAPGAAQASGSGASDAETR